MTVTPKCLFVSFVSWLVYLFEDRRRQHTKQCVNVLILNPVCCGVLLLILGLRYLNMGCLLLVDVSYVIIWRSPSVGHLGRFHVMRSKVWVQPDTKVQYAPRCDLCLCTLPHVAVNPKKIICCRIA